MSTRFATETSTTRPTGRTVRLFIDGQWREGHMGDIPVVDPATESEVGRLQLASAEDLDQALAAADNAFTAWSATPAAERGAILRRAADALRNRQDDTVEALISEAGKTRNEARAEISRAIQTFMWNGEQAARIEGRIISGTFRSSERLSIPTPVGVVAAFTAWNFPAVLLSRKLGAALAAGCTVVLKASEQAPSAAAELINALAAAGVPDGVVNLVFGDPPTVSKHLIASSVVKAMTFTGSTAVGKVLAALAAPRLLRCVLELGGHAPVIVCEDADPDYVVATTSPAKFGSAGQSCVAPSRYFVHRSLYEEFAAKVTDAARALRVGNGHDPDVTIGPVVSQSRLDAMSRLTADAVSKGARLLCGGERIGQRGYFWSPTVLADVPPNAAIMREEPFGPIVPLIPYDDFDAALDQANATDYGFSAYVFTDSLSRRNRAVKGLNATNIGINQMAPSLPDAPLGGVGDSCVGYEGGQEGIDSFLHYRLLSQTASAQRAS